MSDDTRGRRRILQGRVTSAKMDKTIVVTVERLLEHPKYKKYVRRSTRYFAHDEKREARAGDLVEIQETRPISRRKRWRLVRIVDRSRLTESLATPAVETAIEADTAATGAAK